MGFRGNPLQYDKQEDKNRSFSRELLLRILKGFDKRRASINLSEIEQRVSIWLESESFLIGDQKTIDLR